MAPIALKRVYEPAQVEDGTRVLVDRLWPRGLRKDKADLDLWAKDVTPSISAKVRVNVFITTAPRLKR